MLPYTAAALSLLLDDVARDVAFAVTLVDFVTVIAVLQLLVLDEVPGMHWA